MKVRDLQKSHDFRQAIKSSGGEVPPRRRVFVAQPSTSDGKEICSTPSAVHHVKKYDLVADTEPKTDESSVKVFSNNDVDDNNNSNTSNINNSLSNAPIDKEIREVQGLREELREWVKERKALREGLNSLCLTERILRNKPDKTMCEARVLNTIIKREEQKNKKTGPVVRIASPNITPAHVGALPQLDTPLPIALAIIADHLQQKRLRLVDLFSRSDRNKDWLTTRDELRTSLKASGVPLNDMQINDLVCALDVNLDNQLSYKELAMGIEAYRKDRRWQKLKVVFDALVESGDLEDKEIKDFYSNRNNAMNSLSVPGSVNDRQNAELKESLAINVRRQQQLAERQKKRNVKIKGGINAQYRTTLEGVHGDSKIRHLQFLDNECKRCIEQIYLKHLPSKSEHLVGQLIPPAESARPIVHIGCERSMFPFNHSLNKRYRQVQEAKRDRRNSLTDPVTLRGGRSQNGSLPRVATLDFRERAKEGRRRRELFAKTSPTPCWPQHLLDKMRIYMDSEDGVDGGREVLFAQVRQ